VQRARARSRGATSGRARAPLARRETLLGNQRRDNFGDPGPVSIARRISVAFTGNRYSTYGPTPTHRASLEIAEEGLGQLTSELQRIRSVDFPALEARLDEARVPWTPGR
jgi:hypothetical protein